MNTNLIVSVVINTYNHRNYIAQSIESVLMQKTNFPFEIIIGEDESVDGTREICQEYATKYPEIIRLFLRSRKEVIFVNGRPTGRYNFMQNIKNAKGKYIAICPGDDYWTDPLKLQKQVDILEANHNYVMCHHWQELSVKNSAGEFETHPGNKEGHGYLSQEVTGVEEIFKFRMRPQTRTLMFRNIFTKEDFPAWFYKVQFGDLALALILGNFGKFYFIDEVMAAYRITGKGSSSVFNDYEGFIAGNKAWLKIWAYALSYHNNKYTGDALIGMNVFIKRIRQKCDDSISERLKLSLFVLFKLRLNFSTKGSLLNRIFSNK